MQKLAFVTSNPGKAQDVARILGFPLEIVSLELDEMQDLDVERVTRRKAEDAYAKLLRPVIVDDVGVLIHAWDGFPGPFIKYLLKDDNRLFRHFLSHESDRSGTVIVTIGYHDGQSVHLFSERVNGNFISEPKGTDGWGFDSLFIHEGMTKTYAEMGPGEKSKISSRKRALERLKIHLEEHPL